MTIEDDVARVHQVTEALAGPQKVWVLLVDGDEGITCAVYATEKSAREAWASCIKANYSDRAGWQDALSAINTGLSSLEFPNMTNWALRQHEVNA